MTTWHYQATHCDDHSQDVFEVREVYEGGGYTKDAIAPTGETLDELRDDLRRMLADIEKFPVLEVGE